MPAMWVEISSVALAVWLASDLTSAATTAKPRPASPARAASMVALSARRLVCSAIAVISLTTSPISWAARDNLPMRPSVCCACSTAASAILFEFAHPAADLVDRGGKLLGRGGHRLHAGGGFFGSVGDLAGQALGAFRGPGQHSRRLFELNGGSRHVRDDGANGGFEIIGKPDQLGAPRRAGRLVLGILGACIALRLGDCLHLEFFHRAGHLAEFIPAAETRQHDIEIAAGEFAHRLAHRNHGTGNSLAQHQRQRRTEQEAAAGEHQDQPLGLADRPYPIRIRAFAGRKAGPPSSRSAPLTIASAESPISATSSSTCLELAISLASTFPYSSSRPATSFRPCKILSFFDDIAFIEFSTNLSRAIAPVAIA